MNYDPSNLGVSNKNLNYDLEKLGFWNLNPPWILSSR
jgi:hypothetical protein